MTVAIKLLRDLQRRIAKSNHPEWPDALTEKLWFFEGTGGLHLEFYGSAGGESCHKLLDLLCVPEVAAKVVSLVLRGPDEGRDGIREWNLHRLATCHVTFHHLIRLFVEPTQPGHRHRSTLAGADADGEAVAALLSRLPVLESLTLPAVTGRRIFEGMVQPIQELSVDGAAGHHGFIAHLAASPILPRLQSLDFRDVEDGGHHTPFADYRALFESTAFDSVRSLVLREARIAPDQLRQLKRLRPDLDITLIDTRVRFA